MSTAAAILRSLGCCALLLASAASPAFAQATRTWVSGIGDDVNACSRTAPCLTLAVAFSKTAVNGEIDALDPGEFGGVLITHAITIDGHKMGLGVGGPTGPTSATGPVAPTAIVVAAGAGDVVTLRNLQMNGLGSEPVGVQFVSGAALFVEHCTFEGFTQAGIDFEPASNAFLALRDVRFSHVQNAAVFAQGLSGAIANIVIHDSMLDVSGSQAMSPGAFGLLAQAGAHVAVYRSTISGATAAGVEGYIPGASDPGSSVDINLERVSFGGNVTSFSAIAPVGAATVRISNVTSLDNTGPVASLSGAGKVLSFANNRLLGVASGVCTTTFDFGPATLPPAALGAAFSAPLTAVGAQGLASVSLLSGTLPVGLALADNMLSGVPTAAGDYSFSLLAQDSHGCAVSRSYVLSVPQTDATVSFVVSPNPASAGEPITVTITVSSTPPASGTVTLLDGTTVIGTAVLDANGQASIVIGNAGAGEHNLSVAYSGDINHPASSSGTGGSLAVAGVAVAAVPDFSLDFSVATLEIGDGSSATATFTVTPIAGFVGDVVLNCSAPESVSCALDPSTLTVGGAPSSTQITVTLLKPLTAAQIARQSLAGALVVGLLGLARLRRKRLTWVFGFVCIAACAATTTAGKSATITVQATSGTLSHSAALTVTQSH